MEKCVYAPRCQAIGYLDEVLHLARVHLAAGAPYVEVKVDLQNLGELRDITPWKYVETDEDVTNLKGELLEMRLLCSLNAP